MGCWYAVWAAQPALTSGHLRWRRSSPARHDRPPAPSAARVSTPGGSVPPDLLCAAQVPMRGRVPPECRTEDSCHTAALPASRQALAWGHARHRRHHLAPHRPGTQLGLLRPARQRGDPRRRTGRAHHPPGPAPPGRRRPPPHPRGHAGPVHPHEALQPAVRRPGRRPAASRAQGHRRPALHGDEHAPAADRPGPRPGSDPALGPHRALVRPDQPGHTRPRPARRHPRRRPRPGPPRPGDRRLRVPGRPDPRPAARPAHQSRPLHRRAPGRGEQAIRWRGHRQHQHGHRRRTRGAQGSHGLPRRPR